MSPEYCDEKNCPACDLKRHMRHVLDAGCPPEELVEMVIRGLAAVVRDSIEIQYAGELPDINETWH